MGGSGSRLMSSTVNTTTINTEGYRVSASSNGSPRIVANSYSNMIAGIEAQGYQVDAAYRRRSSGDDEILLYRNGQEYRATYNRYSDGDYEITLRRR